MEFLLIFCLSVQIVLSIFAPGLPIGGRTFFIVDFWVFITLGSLAFESYWIEWRPDRKLVVKFLSLIFLFGVIFAHGKSRARIPEHFLQLSTESDEFNPGHEFVIMLRFLSWIVEAVWLWRLIIKMDSATRDSFRKSMTRALSWITFAAAALTILTGLDRAFLNFMADTYGYGKSLGTWPGRAFGSFMSPLESGLTLSLCGLLIFSSLESGKEGRALPHRAERYFRAAVLFLAAVGTILTRTLTALIAVTAAALLSRFGKLRLLARVLTLFGVISGVALTVILLQDFFVGKWAEFIFRVGPWKAVYDAFTDNWHSILLGIGFLPINIDNAYLFLIFKLGIVGAGILGYGALQWGGGNWKQWNVSQRQVILFLLISGMSLDTFIIRPVVMVFIAAGLPLLAPRESA